MDDRDADDRSPNFAGDLDEAGRPVSMSYAAQGPRWKMACSPHTPEAVASLLARSWQMFADGHYTYENFADSAVKSLQAVEAALGRRVRKGNKDSFCLPDKGGDHDCGRGEAEPVRGPIRRRSGCGATRDDRADRRSTPPRTVPGPWSRSNGSETAGASRVRYACCLS